mmetsp:Transcript_6764/g.9881  ORF Transcript_6764/g.9881 Transcript_6764/m.9881 type:complete len:116 (-) Transcript_6764:396-743(-)
MVRRRRRPKLQRKIGVSLVLHDLGHMPRGIRLDSGDLSYLSLTVHRIFLQFATDHPDRSFFKDLDIAFSQQARTRHHSLWHRHQSHYMPSTTGTRMCLQISRNRFQTTNENVARF